LLFKIFFRICFSPVYDDGDLIRKTEIKYEENKTKTIKHHFQDNCNETSWPKTYCSLRNVVSKAKKVKALLGSSCILNDCAEDTNFDFGSGLPRKKSHLTTKKTKKNFSIL